MFNQVSGKLRSINLSMARYFSSFNKIFTISGIRQEVCLLNLSDWDQAFHFEKR